MSFLSVITIGIIVGSIGLEAKSFIAQDNVANNMQDDKSQSQSFAQIQAADDPDQYFLTWNPQEMGSGDDAHRSKRQTYMIYQRPVDLMRDFRHLHRAPHYGNHCGLGRGRAGVWPIDAYDAACYKHDRCLERNSFQGDVRCHFQANRDLYRAHHHNVWPNNWQWG
ncbi:phospholipase a2 domain-containing protein [Ditylenchus destructor]|nr:phospholipase a2 domain-containing protein [Ditylenchus destructor]